MSGTSQSKQVQSSVKPVNVIPAHLTDGICKIGMHPNLMGASHFCRNNLLWGGHPARPLALTGKMPVPQENVFALIEMQPNLIV